MSRLAEMVNGFQRTCVLLAMIETGLVERLLAGPGTLSGLARELRLDASSLERLLRALKSLGMAEEAGSEWSLSGLGALLGKESMGSGLRAWAELVSGEYLDAWSGLADCVRSGNPSFPAIFGQSAWQHRQAHPALNEAFQRLTRGEQQRAVSGLLRAYSFDGISSVMDVGGGQGQLLAGVLRAHPNLSGILFDLPQALDGARAALEPSEVWPRCRLLPGSFLETPPEPVDLYLLKHVLHNWSDSDCRRILRHIGQGAPERGKLLILENFLPESDSEVDAGLAMLDLHMLVVHGGRERRLSEYQELLAASGWRALRHIATRPGAPDILEALKGE